MIRQHIASGLGKARRRWPLILLIYGFTLAVAALLAVPAFRVIDLVFGESGFSPELARRFDLVLWADFIRQGGSGLSAVFRQFIWAIPLFAVWKTASHFGLIHALRGEADGSFWQGVSRYTLRGLLLMLMYLALGVFLLAALWIVLSIVISGLEEPGQVWTSLVIGPLLTVWVIGTLDFTHDYARMHMALAAESVPQAFLSGFSWSLRRLRAITIYKLWFWLAAVLWLIPFWVDATFAKATLIGMLGAFLLQQVIILLRNATTVAWVGSQLSFFEAEADLETAPEAIEPLLEDRDGSDLLEGLAGDPNDVRPAGA